MDPETITIGKALYDELVRNSVILETLRDYGVDNWEWYGEAMATFHESYDAE